MTAGEGSSERGSFPREVADRFGMLPNILGSAGAEPLWLLARSAYLDSPLPSLLKERLVVHLSRFCENRYCIVRHSGFLIGLGRPAGDAEATPMTLEQLMRLLRRPIPDAMQRERIVAGLEARAEPSGPPAPETEEEAQLFDALTVLFLTPARAARARDAVRKLVGDEPLERLAALLAFVRAAHYWTEAHPEITYEPDMAACMDRHPELAAVLLDAADMPMAPDIMALRESEMRYRALFNAIDEGFCVVEMLYDGAGKANDYRFLQVNPAFEDQTGLKDAVGRRIRELAPDHEAYWFEIYGEIARTRQPQRFENRADALGHWYEVFAFPIDDPALHRVGVIFNDIATRKRAEQALLASERRLQTLVEGVPQMVWRAVDSGLWTWASPQWTDYSGQSDQQSLGLGWLDPVHPDDRDRVKTIWGEAWGSGEFSAEYRVLHAPDGRYRWFQTRATPVRDDSGAIVEWLGTSTDVDDLRRLQGRQQMLLGELQHRVRNILTVVRSVFGRTMEAGGEFEDIADHFKGRLDSLARTQAVVTQSASGFADLENLIRDELLSVAASDGPGLTIGGPEVLLPAKAAESIGLAIHELTTNALKYGALGVAGGSLDIRWTVSRGDGEQARLDLLWTEQGVPAMIVDPVRYGFGSELISEALPYQLGAETSLEFDDGGMRCTLSVPLPEDAAGPIAVPVWKEG